jgi:hypothetical protein
MAKRWAWMDPVRSLELSGRAASVVLGTACLANVLLYAVANPHGWFQATISIASALAYLGMMTRIIWPISRVSEEATWLCAGVWIANLCEVSSADIRIESKLRQAGFYLAFALGSIFLYLVERISRQTDVRPVTAAMEAAEEHSGA